MDQMLLLSLRAQLKARPRGVSSLNSPCRLLRRSLLDTSTNLTLGWTLKVPNMRFMIQRCSALSFVSGGEEFWVSELVS